jgi:A/G-specific adenine glycosylase
MIPAQLRTIIWEYYKQHGRHDLPWRKNITPYKIVVSEIMLQQTQVGRVIPKFESFVIQFPSFKVLAAASQAEVITAWSGLGYNRRAKALHGIAQTVTTKHKGQLPHTIEQLVELPGIGVNTAGAIMAYAFNQPAIFLETNVRSILLHHFFAGQSSVHDKQLLPLLEKLVDTKQPREFYWALMDYGTHLKATVGNTAKNSKHFTKQSKFTGSLRQVRGSILKQLAAKPQTTKQLEKTIVGNIEHLPEALKQLKQESFIANTGRTWRLV